MEVAIAAPSPGRSRSMRPMKLESLNRPHKNPFAFGMSACVFRAVAIRRYGSYIGLAQRLSRLNEFKRKARRHPIHFSVLRLLIAGKLYSNKDHTGTARLSGARVFSSEVDRVSDLKQVSWGDFLAHSASLPKT